MASVPAVQVVGVDVEVPIPTPRGATVESLTGTPGTGGVKTIGTFNDAPVPDPHQVWKFTVNLPSMSGVAKPIVQSLEPGFDNTSPENFPIGGRHHFTANFFDASELHLVFYDDINHTPIDYIYAWKKLMRNYDNNTGIDDGTYSYSINYYKDISVFLTDMQNNNRYQLIYKDCFPTAMHPIRLDYGPSERTVIAQSFAVNRIITKSISAQASTANPSRIAPAGAAFRLQVLQP
jgi:hypothetical protein